ncbi:(deoxy)nucleoside triphosphate pyrophosphohydrolase [Streptacidiphilus cavernicola]|uniref:8-oxo-dGTP diphosphatase n=1 Tax=Streptacidiphilus cavernicola TaxID=3342716 RepID=A0ABV6VUW5_9ACTN
MTHSDTTARRIVVGAALLADGRVLAARRSAPAETAGRWEFPGGKLEQGETAAQALVRELREELGVEARALARIPGAWPVRADLELQIWTAELLSGTPAALQDHSELRWLTAAELDSVDWLDQDRFALPAVAALLTLPAER